MDKVAVQICGERRRLWRGYHHAFELYIEAHDLLSALSFGPEYDLGWERVERARAALEQQENEYHKHMHEHGCGHTEDQSVS